MTVVADRRADPRITSCDERRTVLFFAHECAPFHRRESTVGAQRPAQFAKYLPESGWRAIVVCRDASRQGTASRDALHAVRGEVASAMTASDPNQSIVIPVPSLPYDGTTDRLWRMASMRSGSAVTRVARKSLTVAKFLTGDYSQSWQPCAQAAADAVAEATAVDVCVAEHSPDAGIFLARWFAEKYGVPWIADFRDPILQPLAPAARAIYRPIAQRLLASAGRIVGVNEHWCAIDSEIFGRPTTSIPNGFDPDEYKDRTCAPSADGPLTISYIGNVTAQQDLGVFLDGLGLACGELGDGRGRLRFLYRGLMADFVGAKVRATGVDAISDVGDFIPRDEALRAQQSSDLLLVLSIARPESEDVYFRRGMHPAKVFECLGAYRPIVCVPGDRGLLDQLMVETGSGVVLRDAGEVCRYVVDAVRARELGVPIPFAPHRDAVARYSRRALAGRFAGVLDAVAAAHRGIELGVKVT